MPIVLLYSALSNAKKGEKTVSLHIDNYGDVRFSVEVCCSALYIVLENSVSGGYFGRRLVHSKQTARTFGGNGQLQTSNEGRTRRSQIT